MAYVFRGQPLVCLGHRLSQALGSLLGIHLKNGLRLYDNKPNGSAQYVAKEAFLLPQPVEMIEVRRWICAYLAIAVLQKGTVASEWISSENKPSHDVRGGAGRGYS
ncbi:hypothetical protein RRG08_004423 [Elysia crispata]|uniref:Uncharacterized protein n=1 Tax=Elysia crispata TaxID=231223 RepID=A0AAE0Y5Q9_9GAST|nr:hypothetical protein RRG08_004423 [Elysia crispata]